MNIQTEGDIYICNQGAKTQSGHTYVRRGRTHHEGKYTCGEDVYGADLRIKE